MNDLEYQLSEYYRRTFQIQNKKLKTWMLRMLIICFSIYNRRNVQLHAFITCVFNEIRRDAASE